jgi:glutamate formiminotransferase
MRCGHVLIECVPNYSEGRDPIIIDAITNSIKSVDDVSILDVDMGYDFNRTVVTMVGQPESVLEAAILSTAVAIELIDMRKHHGEHARMGAVDVVPFIPLEGATIETCISLSERYAEAVSVCRICSERSENQTTGYQKGRIRRARHENHYL